MIHLLWYPLDCVSFGFACLPSCIYEYKEVSSERLIVVCDVRRRIDQKIWRDNCVHQKNLARTPHSSNVQRLIVILWFVVKFILARTEKTAVSRVKMLHNLKVQKPHFFYLTITTRQILNFLGSTLQILMQFLHDVAWQISCTAYY